MDTQIFGQAIQQLGFGFFSGVPCSFLQNLINYSINHCTFVMNTNEGDAVACCAGARLAQQKSVALMQNSGLTNATSPLTSLVHTFKIPLLGFVSLRGEPGLADEPQHQLMGQITGDMLSLMGMHWDYLSNDQDSAIAQLHLANAAIDSGRAYFFVVRKDTFSSIDVQQQLKPSPNCRLARMPGQGAMPTRQQVLQCLVENEQPGTHTLATTGKTGRELYDIADAPNRLYMVGSMGCASSLGLGVALHTSKPIVAIDGDGALLMRMGNLATNGFYGSDNFLHLLIDNHMHDSTGGQPTLAHNVDFVQIAASCGYTNSLQVHSLEQLARAFVDWQQQPQLTFIHIGVAPGTKANLGRPTELPPQIAQRFMQSLDA